MKSITTTVVLVAAVGLSQFVFGQEAQPQPQTLFTNVNIFDGTSEELSTSQSVLVEGNLIMRISGDAINAPDATVIDGGGGTLMPGLIDSHAHFNMNGTSLANLESMRWDEIGESPPRRDRCLHLSTRTRRLRRQ